MSVKYVCLACKKEWGHSKCTLKVGDDDLIPDRCPYSIDKVKSEWKRVDPKV
jgi:DNA-directed RNA polymerase subunit RPC12/RpoP